jgi:putative ABC transport system permease protein
MRTLWQDLRYGLRMLAKSPGYTAVAVLTLALGIGANTAIFSAVNPILFESLPYPQAARLMMIWDVFKGERSAITFHTYREVAARNNSFSAVAAMDVWQPTMTGPAEPERLDGQRVSAAYFRVLGVEPAMGRSFLPSDDVHNGARTAILSDGLWRRRFDADPTIIGHQITLDGDSFAVVGVMPRAFENLLEPSTEIWSPLRYDSSHATDFQTSEWGHHMHMVGRMRAGVTVDRARADLETIARSPQSEFPRPPWAALKFGFIVNPLQHEITRGVKAALIAVLSAVALVLLIACLNVTNLLLARGVQRRGEFATRAALGAPRSRLIRQLLAESLLLAVIGGALGMLVAQGGVSAIVTLSPPELPRIAAIAVNSTVFAFALGITTLIGLAVGLVPAVQASRTDLRTAIQQSTQRVSSAHQWTRGALVVGEVALALVLLVSAGLLLRSVERLFSVAPGFDSANLLTMQLQTSGRQFDTLASAPDAGANARRRFFEQALQEARRVPGVASASFTSLLPLSGDQSGTYGALFEHDKAGGGYGTFRYVVTPGYFETMRIPLRRGRFLNEGDRAGAPPAVVISESLARTEFHGADPLGQRVHIGPRDRPWYTVVGVVADVKQTSLAINDPNAVYLTTGQSWFADRAMSLVVRVHGNAATLAPAIRSAIWSVDKDQPILKMATMDSLLTISAAQQRFALVLFETFGCLALILAAIGIYGVLSSSVNERTKEMGIRLALGAPRENILGLMLRQGMTMTALGSAIGLLAAMAASQILVSLLFGISRLDPVTYAGVILLVAGVSVLACWLPARRAARVDPMVALRSE